MPLAEGAAPFLEPPAGAGSGMVRERRKAFLSEIIERVNTARH